MRGSVTLSQPLSLQRFSPRSVAAAQRVCIQVMHPPHPLHFPPAAAAFLCFCFVLVLVFVVLRVCDVAARSYMLHMSVINPLAANATVTRTSNGYASPPLVSPARIQSCL